MKNISGDIFQSKTKERKKVVCFRRLLLFRDFFSLLSRDKQIHDLSPTKKSKMALNKYTEEKNRERERERERESSVCVSICETKTLTHTYIHTIKRGRDSVLSL
jgi:hypothetical protein